MNPIGRIFKSTMILGSAHIIQRAGSIVLAFFVARILHAEGLGVYAAAMAIYELVAVAGEMGATNLLVREVGKEPANTNRYLMHLAVMSAGVSAVLMLVLLLLLPYLGYSPELMTAMYIVVLAIVPGTLKSILEGVFVAHQRVEFVTYTTALTTLVNLAVSLYLLLTGFGIISLVIAFVISQLVLTLCYVFFINRHIVRLRWEFDRGVAKSLLREIRAFAALAILAALFARPEVILLTLLSTEAEVGFYSAALRVITLWQIVPQMYMTNVFPVLARAYHAADEDAQLIQDKSIKYLLALSLPVAAVVMVAAEPIIRLLYGDGFGPSVLALRVLALNIPLAAMFSVLWRVLVARGRQDKVLQAMLIATGVELVGDYILISGWGSLGAAVITPAISLLYVLLLLFQVRREGTRVRPVQLGWRFGLAAVGMGLLTWALSLFVNIWLLLPGAALAYVLLVLALRGFAPDDVALFRELWDSRVRLRGRRAVDSRQ